MSKRDLALRSPSEVRRNLIPRALWRCEVHRRSGLGEIDFIGFGRMGAATTGDLAAKELQVIAYVRRPDQIGEFEAVDLRPTTDIGDLFHCDVAIGMLPDDNAVHEIVFGRGDIGLDGLAAGPSPARSIS